MSEQPRVLGGRYEVGALIGRGGMAEVHVGHDLRLGRTVAVKILRTDLARDSSFLARFRREAQSAAGLNHPAIVAVYDSGEQEVAESGGGAPVHVPYIVMEHVEGRTLRELLNDEKVLDPDEAARITAAVLAALEFSHERGIVHRDIKPANVMVTRGGAVKVMDFGIARALADTAATMTQTSAVLGTARYLSPEQAQGEGVDARSDLYSAGCLFYELLTGRTPFVGDPVSLVYQHLGEQAKPPSALQEDLPPEMDAVALHALRKRADERYQSAAEFRHDLNAARAGGPVSDAAQATLAAVLGAGAAGAGVAGAAAAAPPEPTEAMRRPGGAAQRGAGAAAGAAGGAAAAGAGDPLDGYEETDEIPVREERHRGGWLLLGLLALLAMGGVGWVMFQVLGPGEANDTPPTVAVPEVVGLTQQVAERRLADAELEARPEQVTSEEEPGTVVSQDPPAQQPVEVGSTVTIEVSQGPDAVQVPDVSDYRQEAARVVLEQANLRVADEVERRHDPEFDAGRVVATDPEAGQEVDPRETVVTLIVASGRVEVPELQGTDASEAIAELRDRRLTHGEEMVYVETSEVAPNTVLEQSVAAGEVVDYGTVVELTVAREPTQVVTETETAPAPPAETVTQPPEQEPPPEEDEETEQPPDDNEETEGPAPTDDEGDATEQP